MCESGDGGGGSRDSKQDKQAAGVLRAATARLASSGSDVASLSGVSQWEKGREKWLLEMLI